MPINMVAISLVITSFKYYSCFLASVVFKYQATAQPMRKIMIAKKVAIASRNQDSDSKPRVISAASPMTPNTANAPAMNQEMFAALPHMIRSAFTFSRSVQSGTAIDMTSFPYVVTSFAPMPPPSSSA